MSEPKVYNNTELSREAIEAMVVVGKIKNNWRRRDVTLYADAPTLEAIADKAPLGYLYSIGVAFDGSFVTIAKEELGRNEHVAMDYWAHGQKVLARD